MAALRGSAPSTSACRPQRQPLPARGLHASFFRRSQPAPRPAAVARAAASLVREQASTPFIEPIVDVAPDDYAAFLSKPGVTVLKFSTVSA